MLRCKRLLIKYYLPFGKPFLRMINYDPWTFDIRVQRSSRTGSRPVSAPTGGTGVSRYVRTTLVQMYVPTTRASLRARRLRPRQEALSPSRALRR